MNAVNGRDRASSPARRPLALPPSASQQMTFHKCFAQFSRVGLKEGPPPRTDATRGGRLNYVTLPSTSSRDNDGPPRNEWSQPLQTERAGPAQAHDKALVVLGTQDFRGNHVTLN